MQIKTIVTLSTIAFVLLVTGGMYGCPKYEVWQQGLKGEAELARAEQNRKIKIQEAEAEKAAASLKADAEVERAKGVAEANRILADGLKGHEEYLRYLWIEKVANNANREIIYVPTEASLPVLEAGKTLRGEK
jgi:regulator of protease activity HflC (stomatin/prohibitin superfamily)